jgi:membrane protease YdiL (CAAX protease family)
MNVIDDENILIGVMRVYDSILFFLIASCIKHQISTEIIEPGRFPIYCLFISGAFLIIECSASLPRDILSLAIYLVSIVIVFNTAKKKTNWRFQPDWLALGITTLATLTFLFLVYVPLFFPDFVFENWILAYFENPNPGFWISNIFANFSHAAMLEEPIFRFLILRKLDDLHVKPWLAIFIQSLLFCIAHVGWRSTSILVAAFSLSIIFGLSSTYSKRITSVIINHTLYNVLTQVATLDYWIKQSMRNLVKFRLLKPKPNRRIAWTLKL